MEKIPMPELAEGETYIAMLFDATTQQGHHIILLPGDNDGSNWQTQMDWAKSIGGDLPNRIEQSMLWANHRDQFKKDWYWSNETHHSVAGCAWSQHFNNGDQYDYPKDDELRARAVRRLPI